MNTARWTAWVTMLRQSDWVMVQLATMAVAAVLVWEQMRQVPEPWQGRLRSTYLLGLLILFAYLIGGQMDTTAYTVGVFVVTFLTGGALAIWLVRRKAQQAREAAQALAGAPSVQEMVEAYRRETPEGQQAAREILGDVLKEQEGK